MIKINHCKYILISAYYYYINRAHKCKVKKYSSLFHIQKAFFGRKEALGSSYFLNNDNYITYKDKVLDRFGTNHQNLSILNRKNNSINKDSTVKYLKIVVSEQAYFKSFKLIFIPRLNWFQKQIKKYRLILLTLAFSFTGILYFLAFVVVRFYFIDEFSIKNNNGSKNQDIIE